MNTRRVRSLQPSSKTIILKNWINRSRHMKRKSWNLVYDITTKMSSNAKRFRISKLSCARRKN